MDTAYEVRKTILELTEQDTALELWIEAFLKDRKASGLSPGTLNYYREKLALFMGFCNGRLIKLITQITPNDIRDYLLFLEEKGHNRGGQHCCFRTLRAFLYWWERELEPGGWSNPIRKVKAPKVPQVPLEPASIQTVNAILATCKNNYYGIRDKAMIMTLVDTGTRASELLSINIEDVDQVNGSIMIRHAKGGKFRNVFLGKRSRKALRGYMRYLSGDQTGPLWISRYKEGMTYSALKMLLKRRARTAKVKPAMPHSFRRLFALEMLRNGADLFSLQLLMGHSDLSILRRYLKQTNGDLRIAHTKGSPMDRLNKLDNN